MLWSFNQFQLITYSTAKSSVIYLLVWIIVLSQYIHFEKIVAQAQFGTYKFICWWPQQHIFLGTEVYICIVHDCKQNIWITVHVFKKSRALFCFVFPPIFLISLTRCILLPRKLINMAVVWLHFLYKWWYMMTRRWNHIVPAQA